MVLQVGRPDCIRAALTAYTSLRAVRLPVRVDTEPIVRPGIPDFSDLFVYVVPFWNHLRSLNIVPKVDTVRWKRYHFTTKAGPQKGPALFGALSDLVALPDRLAESIKFLGGQVLSKYMDTLMKASPLLFSRGWFPLNSGAPIRRVAGIPDAEGKTRVIALLDYWSQTALGPVHDFLFKILRGIPQDMTHSQGSFVDVVRK